jgi:site-specific recombinase XerD
MEYLQQSEVAALMQAAYEYGHKEAHLCLLVMYSSGTRVSQALALKGVDVITDPTTGGYKIRVGAAKSGRTRSFRLMASPNPAFDMTPIVELSKTRGTSALFGGLSRCYLHVLIKKFAAVANLHVEMVSCHKIRHSVAMRIYESTQRIGVVSAYLCHVDASTAYTYVAEGDSQVGDETMTAVFATA